MSLPLEKRYGRPDIKLLASNNPDALSSIYGNGGHFWYPAKILSSLSSSDLAGLYDAYEQEGGIHDAVVATLRARALLGPIGQGGPASTARSFGLLRMGFESWHQVPDHSVVVLLIIVSPGFQGDAKSLVLELEAQVDQLLNCSAKEIK